MNTLSIKYLLGFGFEGVVVQVSQLGPQQSLVHAQVPSWQVPPFLHSTSLHLHSEPHAEILKFSC